MPSLFRNSTPKHTMLHDGISRPYVPSACRTVRGMAPSRATSSRSRNTADTRNRAARCAQNVESVVASADTTAAASSRATS
eukprot:6198765-Pleurochrysis_carterae.AAC.2